MSQVTVYKGNQHFTYLSGDDDMTIIAEARSNFDADRVEIAPHQPFWAAPEECPVSEFA